MTRLLGMCETRRARHVRLSRRAGAVKNPRGRIRRLSGILASHPDRAMMHRRTFLILHVLACRLLVPSFAATGDAQVDVPDASWRQGPVRYTLVVQEDHEYKSLATDGER